MSKANQDDPGTAPPERRARHYAKRCVVLAAAVVVLPMIVAARLERWLSPAESWFGACTATLSLVPGKLGDYLRLAFYRFTLQKCSCDACFSFGVLIAHRTAEIGRHVTIGARSILGTVTIDDHVLIGSRVSITSGGRQHNVDDPTKNITEDAPVYDRVRVGSNTWIGEGAVVLADVGSRCVVAAGSVVFRPVPSGKMAMGNPARPIARNFDSGRDLDRQEAVGAT